METKTQKSLCALWLTHLTRHSLLYFSSIDIDEKIHFCEYVYQKKNLPAVFKMTSSVYSGDLGEKLHAHGYQIDSPTNVQTIDPYTVDMQGTYEAEFQHDPSNAWLENFCRMSAVPVMHTQTLQRILINIIPNRCFVSIKVNDRMVACGLGVLQSGYVGLSDIVTDKEFRNRGYGQRIVKSILEWGKQNKAQIGYLQFMLDNVPALHLYSKIGFIEQYQYWYRIKS